MTAKTICLAQSKGGTSKTSSALNISACMVKAGYRVLAVDVDQQASLTASLGDQQQQQPPQEGSPFEAIRQEDENENEYWSARDLAKVLGYTTNFRNFQKVLREQKSLVRKAVMWWLPHLRCVRASQLPGRKYPRPRRH